MKTHSKMSHYYRSKYDGSVWRVLPTTAAAKGEAKADPATFEAHGYTWTRHTPGDPMPCELEAMVEVLFEDGGEADCEQSADDWSWKKHGKTDSIIGWRYADEQPGQVIAASTAPEGEQPSIQARVFPEPPAQPTQLQQAWTPKPGDVVRLKSGGPEMTVSHIGDDPQVGGPFAALVWIAENGFYRTCNATFSALTPAKEVQP